MSWKIAKLLRSVFSADHEFQNGSEVFLGDSRLANRNEAYKNFVFERIREFPEESHQKAFSWSRDQMEIARREWACFILFAIDRVLTQANLPKGAAPWKVRDQIEMECALGKLPEFFAVGRAPDTSGRPPLVKFPPGKAVSASMIEIPGSGIIRNRVQVYSKFLAEKSTETSIEQVVDAFTLIAQIVVHDGDINQPYTISHDMTLQELQEFLQKSGGSNPEFERLLRVHSEAFLKVNSRLISEILPL